MLCSLFQSWGCIPSCLQKLSTEKVNLGPSWTDTKIRHCPLHPDVIYHVQLKPKQAVQIRVLRTGEGVGSEVRGVTAIVAWAGQKGFTIDYELQKRRSRGDIPSGEQVRNQQDVFWSQRGASQDESKDKLSVWGPARNLRRHPHPADSRRPMDFAQ